MADQKTLTDWILAHHAELDLRVKECAWIRDVFPGWNDLEVVISIAGKRFHGRGCDENADTALSKAFCEAVERSLCVFKGFSSLGAAGHTDPEAAKRNAKLEYIERRALFEHFTKRWKFQELKLDSRISERYSARGVKVSLHKLNTDQAEVVFAVANGLESSPVFGGILGLGAHLDGQVAARKALLECLQGLEAFLDRPSSSSLSYEHFLVLESPTPFDRQALFRDPTYFARTMNVFSGESSEDKPDVEGSFEELALEGSLFSSCPLRFFRFVPVDQTDIKLEFVG